DLTAIRPDMRVWKNDDPQLTARLRRTFETPDPQRRTAIDLVATAASGQSLVIEAATATGLACTVSSSQPCAEARQHPLTEATLRQQLGRLGGTPFELRGLQAHIAGRPMLPFSILGELRHKLVQRLEALAQSPPPRRIVHEPVLPGLRTPTQSV